MRRLTSASCSVPLGLFPTTYVHALVAIWLSLSLVSAQNSPPTLTELSYQVIPGKIGGVNPDPTFGYSVAFAPDASAIAVGSSPLSGTAGYKWAGRCEYNATNKLYEQSNGVGIGGSFYLGRHVAIGTDGRGFSSVYYDPGATPARWALIYFANFNAGVYISTCTSQTSQVNIASGQDFLVVGCDTTLHYYQVYAASYNLTSRGTTSGSLTGDMAMTQYAGTQLLLGTSASTVQVRRQTQVNAEFDELFSETLAAPISTGYLQAAIWSNTFAVADGTNNVLVYQFSVIDRSRAVMANISISQPIGDIALGNGSLAVVIPSLGELWVYTNLTTGSQPCVKAQVPSSLTPVPLMSVSIAANTPDLTIAVGVPSTNSSAAGLSFVIINPACSYIPPTTGTTATTESTALTTTAAVVTTATTTTAATVTTATTTTTATTITTATITTATTATITTATTTTGNTKPPSTPCSSNLNISIGYQATCNAANGTWTVGGNVTNNADIVVSSNDNVNIVGNLNLTSSSSLVLYPNTTNAMPSVFVGGVAQLSGGLVIVIDSQLPNNSILITIINASAINGSFEDIQVVQKYSGSKCYKTSARPIYTTTSASLLITTTKRGSCGSKGKTVGIAVGVSLGFVLIVVLVVIIGFFLYYNHKGNRITARMVPLASNESKAVI